MEYGLSSLIKDRVALATKKKKGGVNDPLTEQRAITAEFLEIPIARVCGMTRGWTADQLFRLHKESIAWTVNPKALWWVLYKKYNKVYAKQKNGETKNIK